MCDYCRGHQPVSASQPMTVNRPYSYAEDVDDPSTLLDEQAVDVEQAAPAVPNNPIEQILPQDRGAALLVEE